MRTSSAASTPAPSGASSVTGRASIRRRRRGTVLPIVLFVLALIPAGLFVNLGPYDEYAQAREKLRQKQEEVAVVEQDLAALRAENARLQQDAYLEALARKELAYARPGEEVFIVKGLPEASEAAEAEERAGSEPEPGPLESLVEGFRGAF